MDFFPLLPGSFFSGELLQGYDSLIWTERYREASEFQMITYDIKNTLDAIPVGTLVSHGSTREVMIVEKHVVTIDDNGVRLLTTTGRSLETFLEQRIIANMSGKTFKMIKQYVSYGAAEVLIWNAFVNDTTHNILSDYFDRDPKDRIPNLVVTDSISGLDLDSKDRYLEPGYVYPKFIALLAQDDCGVRCIRPVGDIDVAETKTYNVVDVDLSGSDKGSISRTSTANVRQMIIDIYNGNDLSTGQDILLPVVFSTTQGFLENPQYLWTIENYKNVGYWTSVLGNETWYYDQGAEDKSGLNRRYLFLDFGSDLGSDPAVTIAVTDSARWKTENQTKRRRTKFYFTSESSAELPFKYGTDYRLGDTVSLVADYDVRTTAQVSEFILTGDENGEQGYPTLIVDT